MRHHKLGKSILNFFGRSLPKQRQTIDTQKKQPIGCCRTWQVKGHGILLLFGRVRAVEFVSRALKVIRTANVLLRARHTTLQGRKVIGQLVPEGGSNEVENEGFSLVTDVNALTIIKHHVTPLDLLARVHTGH